MRNAIQIGAVILLSHASLKKVLLGALYCKEGTKLRKCWPGRLYGKQIHETIWASCSQYNFMYEPDDFSFSCCESTQLKMPRSMWSCNSLYQTTYSAQLNSCHVDWDLFSGDLRDFKTRFQIRYRACITIYLSWAAVTNKIQRFQPLWNNTAVMKIYCNVIARKKYVELTSRQTVPGFKLFCWIDC